MWVSLWFKLPSFLPTFHPTTYTGRNSTVACLGPISLLERVRSRFAEHRSGRRARVGCSTVRVGASSHETCPVRSRVSTCGCVLSRLCGAARAPGWCAVVRRGGVSHGSMPLSMPKSRRVARAKRPAECRRTRVGYTACLSYVWLFVHRREQIRKSAESTERGIRHKNSPLEHRNTKTCEIPASKILVINLRIWKIHASKIVLGVATFRSTNKTFKNVSFI